MGLGIWIGRTVTRRKGGLKEPLGVIQGALVGFVALLLAFGLTMAVGRYEARRNAVVVEANAIGTTYLRAQTLAEPMRTESLELLRRYGDTRIALSEAVPDSAKFEAASNASVKIQNRLWTLAGDALNTAPTASAPRLYVETLNEMIDAHTTPHRCARQPHPCTGALAADPRQRPCPRRARHVPRLARPRRPHGSARSRSGHRHAARDLRPRSTTTGIDHRPRRPDRRSSQIDGHATSRQRSTIRKSASLARKKA